MSEFEVRIIDLIMNDTDNERRGISVSGILINKEMRCVKFRMNFTEPNVLLCRLVKIRSCALACAPLEIGMGNMIDTYFYQSIVDTFLDEVGNSCQMYLTNISPLYQRWGSMTCRYNLGPSSREG